MSKIPQLRQEVANIHRATGYSPEDIKRRRDSFESMAKMRGATIHTARYHEITSIVCDTWCFVHGKDVMTEQNLQYYPAKFRYYEL